MEARGRGMNRGTQTVMLMLAMVATVAVLLLWEISPFTLNSNHVLVLNSPIQSFAGIHVDNENKTKASEGPKRDSSSAEFGTERDTSPDEQSFTDLSRQENITENMTENIVSERETAEPDDRSTTENTDKFKVIELFENDDLAESPEMTFAAVTEKSRSEKPNEFKPNSTVQFDERNNTVKGVAGQGFDLEKQGDDQLEGRGKIGGGVTQLSVVENVSGFEVGKGNSSDVEGGESGEEADLELADAVSSDSSVHKATENVATEKLGLGKEDDEEAGITAVEEKAAREKNAEGKKATENLGSVLEDDEAGFTAVVEKGAHENYAERKKATQNLVQKNLGLVLKDDEAGFTAANVEKAAREKNAEGNKATENLGLALEDDEAGGFTAIEEKGAREKNAARKVCDYAVGKWVLDKKHPLYSGRECTMWLSPDWACRLHNHPDKQMDRYRWQPAGCELPVFNASATLESLRNKVVAFVGDSLGRQQWQSLLCMLTRGKNSTPISDTASTFNFYTPRGGRRPTGWAHRFEATNTTIIFKWSVTLAKVETLNISTTALHLDRPEQFLADHLHNLDVVILNSGHHWNNGKMDQNGYKFYANGKPVTNKSVPVAYNQTIHNVINWIHRKTRNSSKAIFYRSISPRHFRNGDWNTGGTCDSIRFEEGKPAQVSTAVDANAVSAVKGTTVKLLNITALSMERGETHVSKYGRTKGEQDCLHWCLPGIPDIWNEILLANLAASNAT